VVDVYGTGKVGIKFELKNSWTSNSDCEVANWHLFIVHVGAYENGAFGPIRVEPGKDMQRLIAALQKAGPAIADAVEKYAPEKVKKASEDGAKWVAESEDAKKIADATGVVLDKVKEKTGVDIGRRRRERVRDLVDPGGETSAEATRRVEAEMAALNASHEGFMKAVQTLGLAPGGEFQSQTQADADEYNADRRGAPEGRQSLRRHTGGGVEADAGWPGHQASRKKAALLAQQAEKKRRDKADSDAQAVADLARRVKASEAAMNAALTRPTCSATRSTTGPGAAGIEGAQVLGDGHEQVLEPRLRGAAQVRFTAGRGEDRQGPGGDRAPDQGPRVSRKECA
jgi:hypothetical protein